MFFFSFVRRDLCFVSQVFDSCILSQSLNSDARLLRAVQAPLARSDLSRAAFEEMGVVRRSMEAEFVAAGCAIQSTVRSVIHSFIHSFIHSLSLHLPHPQATQARLRQLQSNIRHLEYRYQHNIDRFCPAIALSEEAAPKALYRTSPQHLEADLALVESALARQSLWTRAIQMPAENQVVAKQLLASRAELAELTAAHPPRSYADLVLNGRLTSAIGSASAARSLCRRLLPALEAASAREMRWVARNTATTATTTTTTAAGRHETMHPWNVPWCVRRGVAEASHRLRERHGVAGTPLVFAWKPCE